MRTWVHGSDADIGGTSTSNWALGEDGRAKFSGVMRLKVSPEIEGRLRGGYAGIRARVRCIFSTLPLVFVRAMFDFYLRCCTLFLIFPVAPYPVRPALTRSNAVFLPRPPAAPWPWDPRCVVRQPTHQRYAAHRSLATPAVFPG